MKAKLFAIVCFKMQKIHCSRDKDTFIIARHIKMDRQKHWQVLLFNVIV